MRVIEEIIEDVIAVIGAATIITVGLNIAQLF